MSILSVRNNHQTGARPRRALSLLVATLLATWLVTWSTRSAAQVINLNFPAAGSGYDQQLGVTVQSRPRTLYDTPGIQAGGFEIRPNLDQSFAYNSNPTGATSGSAAGSSGGSGSFISRTSGGVSAVSLWPRDALGASVGVDHYHYFSLAAADYTDWNVGLRGGYTLYDSLLLANYAHQSYHQLGATIGTVRSNTPVADETDTAQLSYTFKFHRLDVTPDLSVSAYRYGTATVLGIPVNQQYLNRNVLAAGVTTRYAMNDVGGLLFVARGIESHYVSPQLGQPSNDSQSVMLLSGIDYQAKGPWHYRLLVGGELRGFTAAQYATRVTPTVEGDVTWSPTALTTVTAILSRSISDPQAAGTNGFVLTQASLRIDHELMRNVILRGHTVLQYAQYLGSGTQTNLNFGGGVYWLLNRNMRLSADYDFTRQSAATGTGVVATGQPNTVATGQFTQSLIGLTLHLGL